MNRVPLQCCCHFVEDTQGPFTEDIPQILNKRGKPQAARKRDNTHTAYPKKKKTTGSILVSQ